VWRALMQQTGGGGSHPGPSPGDDLHLRYQPIFQLLRSWVAPRTYDAFLAMRFKLLDPPRVVIVGSQTSGKSSLIERVRMVVVVAVPPVVRCERVRRP
jgi:hypothetical protein